MTQTIDFTNAEATEMNLWLAEQPCPESSCIDGLLEQMCDCGDGPDLHMKKHEACNGLGLAFPWASELCPRAWRSHSGCNTCNGSGRIPKTVGLSLIIVESQKLGFYDAISNAVTKQVCLKWSTGDEITLAALRAYCKSLQ